jgi:hypothetical protein
MRVRSVHLLVQTLSMVVFSLGTLAAQTCSRPPTPNRADDAAEVAFADALVKSGGCMVAGDKGCGDSIAALQNLSVQALAASGESAQCAATGTNNGAPLPADQKTWYLKRSTFWLDLYRSLQQESDAVTKGTYKISDDTRTAFLGVPLRPKPPTITSKVVSGATSLTVKVDKTNFSPSANSNIYVCVWKQKPNSPNAMDCADKASMQKAAPLSNDKVETDGNMNDYLPVTADGSYTLTLKTAIQSPQYVSISQHATVEKKDQQISSADAVAVGVANANQCNVNTTLTPYNDCDMKFSIIAGVEQGAQSSLPSATNPFLRVFTRAGPDTIPRLKLWAYIRLLGAPQTSSTSGVVSVVTDPAGNITTQTFSGIGTSVDFMLGPEFVITKPGTRTYSASLIAGYGATTPLTANTLNQAFKAPAFGTVECATVRSRFTQQFAVDNIIAGTSTNAGTTPSCLVNGSSVTSAPNAATVTFTPVTTIGFSNQDRTNFLGKAFLGVRTVDRFTGSGNLYCGDPDSSKQIGPCERGTVDFIFGQDASITGGRMRHFVFKIDGVHPLPVKSVSFLYLFGSVTIRLTRGNNMAPLILQSGDITSLSGNGSAAVPNAAVVILPLTQPDRDFYRFGAGIDISGIFKKLFSSQAPATQ